MYEVIRTVHLADAEQNTGPALERLRTVTGRIANGDVVVAPTLPGARNGGDLLLRLRFDSAENWARHRAELDEVLAGAEIGRVVGADLEQTAASYTGRRSPRRRRDHGRCTSGVCAGGHASGSSLRDGSFYGRRAGLLLYEYAWPSTAMSPIVPVLRLIRSTSFHPSGVRTQES